MVLVRDIYVTITASLFRYPFHPVVTAVACKRSGSFCQTCRWQITAKHACTLCMWLCIKWQSAWLYVVHIKRRDGSSFMWHQPCQRCKYTTSVDIQKRAVKSHAININNSINLLILTAGGYVDIVRELCESRGGHPGLSVLTKLLVSVDVKNYWTMLRHWSQLVPNMSTDIWGH